MAHIQDILSQTATFLLAGGRGARLAPLTDKRSKPAVPFGDRRVIDFALANCLRSNLKHPSVITQYQGAHLTQHVGRWWLEQSASGAAATASPVCVPCPSRKYLGTADALFRNVQLLDPETRTPRYWKDVGTIDSYYEASMTWLNTLPEDHSLSGSGSVISAGVRIHRTAEVIDSILMPGVVVGSGARVRHAILDENVRVQAGARLGYETSESQTFARTPNGVVVVPANSIIPAASGIYVAPRQCQIRLEPQPARYWLQKSYSLKE